MFQSDEVSGAPQLDFEAWRDLLRSKSGRYYSEGIKPDKFAGWVRPVGVRGFTALDIGSNAPLLERTYRDVHLDGADHYFTVFQASGELRLLHNDQAVRLAAGDVALVDGARPVKYCADGPRNIITLTLPRQSLVSHLGFEPQGGLFRRGGTSAGRVLFSIIRDAYATDGSASSPADSYMQLAIYDLVGALFAPSEPWLGSRHAAKLFTRIRNVINDGFADPDFGPNEVAAETGISLRYLQKLFTERGSTCSELIYALRLEQAARLVHRRTSVGTSQPLSEIAYACGFRDYTHFARKFRHRFGHAPGAHSEELDHAGDGVVRASTGVSAS